MKQGVKRLFSMALALVTIVASFVIFFNGIKPAYSSLVLEQGRLATLEGIAEDRRVAVTKVQELIKDYSGDNATELKSSISLALPLGVDMASALVQLVGLMDLSSIKLNSISPKVESAPAVKPGQVVQPVGVVLYDIGAEGSYDNLKIFLEKLESNTMLFEIRNMRLAPIREGSQTLKINFVVASYYQSE